MPNYVANTLKMKDITKLPLFTEQDGKKCFDFNKVIPMPEALNIESSSRAEWAIVYYLTKRCVIPVGCLMGDDKKIADATVHNQFSRNWLQEVYTRTQKWAYNAPESQKDKLFEDGKQYVDNYKQYGATSWYEWCIENWGTKWNAGSNGQIDDDTIVFKTAWSMPEPVIMKLSQMYPDREIDIMFADEGRGSNTGHIVYQNGQVIRGGYNENGSEDALTAYNECWSMSV